MLPLFPLDAPVSRGNFRRLVVVFNGVVAFVAVTQHPHCTSPSHKTRNLRRRDQRIAGIFQAIPPSFHNFRICLRPPRDDTPCTATRYRPGSCARDDDRGTRNFYTAARPSTFPHSVRTPEAAPSPFKTRSHQSGQCHHGRSPSPPSHTAGTNIRTARSRATLSRGGRRRATDEPFVSLSTFALFFFSVRSV